MNFHGAIFKESNSTSLGGIIRDDKGLVMAMFTQVIPLPTSIKMVEVLTTHRALYFARKLEFDQVIIKGDSKIIIMALNSEDFSCSSFGHILNDIKQSAANFRKSVFCHTCRQCNKVAHKLARLACNFSPFCVWMGTIPPNIVDVYFFLKFLNNT